MAYPAYIAEMGLESNRPKLKFGIWSGYSVVGAFGILAAIGDGLGLVAPAWPLYLLVGVKLFTNTLALFALRANRLALEAQGLNTVTDCVLMTAAIYLTGGQISPLFPIYVIEITVVALLTNLGVTISIAAVIILLYAAMSALVYTGALPAQSPPIVISGGLTLRYLVTDIGYAVFVIGAPTIFASLIMGLLKQKERALREKTVKLVDAGRQKSQFMVNVTHELRTPIHSICGLCELVESGVYGPTSDKQRQASRQIRDSAKGLLQMIDDLLQLARHDAGGTSLSPTQVDVNDLVPAVVASVGWMLGTREMKIDTNIELGLPSIHTDRGKLNQILINLLSNALKFTPEHGNVQVSVRLADEEHVVLEVKDNGPGIDASEHERIFEAFRQVDGSITREYGGVGLGLPLVKRLAELLGGRVEVDSALGSGATFRVFLPLAKGDDACEDALATTL